MGVSRWSEVRILLRGATAAGSHGTPAFVRNLADARHINIAHGLYPRDPMSSTLLNRLAHYLASAVSLKEGRTYAGGLTKFEPREMERLLVPSPQLLGEMQTA